MNALDFGIAHVDITPPVGVMLMGYDPRESVAVGHPLRAEALACADGSGQGWIMISADVCAFNALLTTRIRQDVAQRTGLPAEAVLVLATHTHSGPHVSDALWCERSPMESAYFVRLREALVDVACRAWQARTPGAFVVGQTTAPDLGSNRRVQLPNGTWTNVWADPEGVHTGYFDPTIDLLGVRRPTGALDVLLVNYGCHPVGFGGHYRSISGDYVSYLKDALEERKAVETVLFSVSGHANVDPRHAVQTDENVVRMMGERLAEAVASALPDLRPIRSTVAGAVCVPWDFSTTWEIDGRLAIYFPHAAKGSPVHTSVCAWGVDDLAFIGLPGETVSEYRATFREASPFPNTLLISLVNDFIGYLPTDEILQQGAYEAHMAPLNPMETILTDKGQTALDALYHSLKC